MNTLELKKPISLKDRQFFHEILDGAITTPTVSSISLWAEQNRYMTGKTTSKPGLFDWSNAPYWKEVVDCFSPNSPVREVAVMKGTQVFCTTSVYENIMGFNIGVRATSTLFVTSSKTMQRDFKKIKIDPMVDSCDLRKYVKSDTDNQKTRKTGDTQSLLEYDNGKQGFIRMVGAHNKEDFQSIAYQQALVDEVDLFSDNVGGDGDICTLIKARTDTFGDKAKIGYMSRPTLAHTSIILQKYLDGDQRKWQVPCPFCGEFQALEFYVGDGGVYPDEKAVTDKGGNLVKPYGIMFDSSQCKNGNYSSVAYRCYHCGEDFTEVYQRDMVLKGYWLPTAKSKYPNFRSYHFNGVYVKSWRDIVGEFIRAGNDPNKLQVFRNAILGLPYEDTSTGVDATIVHNKRGDYAPNVLQDGTLFLVASADIQGDRIECEIKAYGEKFISWGVDHRIFRGDTSNLEDECWGNLAKVIDEEWELPNGKKLMIERLGVDSGDQTETVYSFCLKHAESGVVIPLKGFESSIKTRDKFKVVTMKNKGIQLLEIYVDLYKNQLSRYLNQTLRDEDTELPEGYITFAGTYSDEYLRQLTTEKKVKERTSAGNFKIKWKSGGRNEAFDLNVYCLCLAELTLYLVSIDELGLEQVDYKLAYDHLRREANRI